MFLQDVEVCNTGKAFLDLGQPEVVKGLVTLKRVGKMVLELVVCEKITT